jgi:hypothetical protein
LKANNLCLYLFVTVLVNSCHRNYHVGYTRSHLNTEVKQHWVWIVLGWETLQGNSDSVGTAVSL